MTTDPKLVSLLVSACRGTLGGPDKDTLYEYLRGGVGRERVPFGELLAALRELPAAWTLVRGSYPAEGGGK